MIVHTTDMNTGEDVNVRLSFSFCVRANISALSLFYSFNSSNPRYEPFIENKSRISKVASSKTQLYRDKATDFKD